MLELWFHLWFLQHPIDQQLLPCSKPFLGYYSLQCLLIEVPLLFVCFSEAYPQHCSQSDSVKRLVRLWYSSVQSHLEVTWEDLHEPAPLQPSHLSSSLWNSVLHTQVSFYFQSSWKLPVLLRSWVCRYGLWDNLDWLLVFLIVWKFRINCQICNTNNPWVILI